MIIRVPIAIVIVFISILRVGLSTIGTSSVSFASDVLITRIADEVGAVTGIKSLLRVTEEPIARFAVESL